jgi:hypothetical protein
VEGTPLLVANLDNRAIRISMVTLIRISACPGPCELGHIRLWLREVADELSERFQIVVRRGRCAMAEILEPTSAGSR